MLSVIHNVHMSIGHAVRFPLAKNNYYDYAVHA